jgi:hypothetical protein
LEKEKSYNNNSNEKKVFKVPSKVFSDSLSNNNDEYLDSDEKLNKKHF